MSKGKRYTEEQIIKVLNEIDAGASLGSLARSHSVTDQTTYRWREKYAGMKPTSLAIGWLCRTGTAGCVMWSLS